MNSKPTRREQILKVVTENPGISAGEIAEFLGKSYNNICSECNYMHKNGELIKSTRNDGKIVYYSALEKKENVFSAFVDKVKKLFTKMSKGEKCE